MGKGTYSNMSMALLRSYQGDVQDEVEHLVSVVVDVGHGHGKDIPGRFPVFRERVAILTNSRMLARASIVIWLGLSFPKWAMATVLAKIQTSSWVIDKICWILVSAAAWSMVKKSFHRW